MREELTILGRGDSPRRVPAWQSAQKQREHSSRELPIEVTLRLGSVDLAASERHGFEHNFMAERRFLVWPLSWLRRGVLRTRSWWLLHVEYGASLRLSRLELK